MTTNFSVRQQIYLVVAMILAQLSPVIWADDGSTSPNDKPTEKQSKDSAPEQQPKPRSLLEKLGDELLKEADDTPGAKPNQSNENVDKMDRAVKGMRSAGDKLDEGLTADETQKIQKQVIKDLEDIINQLENPPPSQGGGGGGGGGGGAAGRSGRGGSRSPLRLRRPSGAGGRGMSAGKQQHDPSSAEEQSGDQQNEHATDSSKKSQGERKAAEEAARRHKLEMDIWGHLPQHLREELLSTYGERMLPKYEQMVKQFYEALSTQGDPKKK